MWETQALVDRWFYRPIDQAIMRLLLPTSVRPNQVSVFSGLTGFVAALCFLDLSNASLVAVGGVLVLLSNVLDGVDGQLARARRQCSEMGKLLDNIMDPAKTVFMLLFVAIGMHRANGWGSSVLPHSAPSVLWYYALALLTGASLLAQVLTRNAWVETYRRRGKGKSDPNLAHIPQVRLELAEMRLRGGHWLERIIAPVGLFLSRPSRRGPSAIPRPDLGYANRLRPYIRGWTFLAGGTQFTILGVSCIVGEPVLGLIGILTGNLAYVPLLIATMRAHQRAMQSKRVGLHREQPSASNAACGAR